MKTLDEKVFGDVIRAEKEELAPAVLIDKEGNILSRWLGDIRHQMAAALPKKVGMGILLFLHYTDNHGQLHMKYFKALTYNHLPPRLKREEYALRYDYVCVVPAGDAPTVPLNGPHAFLSINFQEHLLHLQAIPLPILVQDELDSKKELPRPVLGKVKPYSIYEAARKGREERLAASGKFARII